MTLHVFPPPSAQITPSGRPLVLGFLCPHNALDRRTFSGTPFHAAQALAARDDIRLRLIGNHRTPRRMDRLLGRRTSEISFDSDDLEDLDAVIGLVATPLLDRLATLRPDLPFLHVTDATPQFLREAYGWSVPAEADALETRVAARSAGLVYSSRLLAGRAADDLGIPGLAAASLPFGVNFETLPEMPGTKPPLDRIELLFVGLDWARKGGDIAVATLEALRAAGRDARLTIVGRCPDRHLDHPAIRATGFLDKNRPRDAARLARLYAEAHLLLVPSRADCTPMVVAEAMAHGTPVLASDTGGIADLIGGQGAGRLLPPFTAPEVWAAAVTDLTGNADTYRFLSDAAFDRAAHHLSWKAWARGVTDLCRLAVAQPATDVRKSPNALVS